MEFLEEIWKSLKIKKLLTDIGKEFNNKTLTKWALDRGISMLHSIPYYHPSSVRVERINRTIREFI